jgi:hypothetical protein
VRTTTASRSPRGRATGRVCALNARTVTPAPAARPGVEDRPRRSSPCAGPDERPVLAPLRGRDTSPSRSDGDPPRRRSCSARVDDPAGARFGGEFGAVPPRQRCVGLGGQGAGQRGDLNDLDRTEPVGPPGPRLISQAVDAVGVELAASPPHRVHVEPEVRGDCGVGGTGSGGEHDDEGDGDWHCRVVASDEHPPPVDSP